MERWQRMSNVDGHGAEPTNWGRWGPDGDLGTLNFITAAARARGVAEAVTGQVVSLAKMITPVPLAGAFGSPHVMPAAVTQTLIYTTPASPGFIDMLTINVHHVDSTHVDAVAHVNSGGRVYPGVPVEEAIAGGTVRRGSSAPFAAGVVTRGVLLDLAPAGALEENRQVTAVDLEEAERRGGVRVTSGDALVVRGGWRMSAANAAVLPTLTRNAVAWMADREVALYAGDIGDKPPILPGGSTVVHTVGLGRLGMPLVDGPTLEELARTCRDLDRYAFLFVLGTIPVTGATGLPVTPLAIF